MTRLPMSGVEVLRSAADLLRESAAESSDLRAKRFTPAVVKQLAELLDEAGDLWDGHRRNNDLSEAEADDQHATAIGLAQLFVGERG